MCEDTDDMIDGVRRTRFHEELAAQNSQNQYCTNRTSKVFATQQNSNARKGTPTTHRIAEHQTSGPKQIKGIPPLTLCAGGQLVRAREQGSFTTCPTLRDMW